MNRKIAYIIILVETVLAIGIGIVGCADGQTKLLKTISIFLLFISFLGIVNLFVSNEPNSKKNLKDLVFSVVIVLINHSMLGLVLGWNECPMV